MTAYYMRSPYCAFVEDLASTRNPRRRHFMVTGLHLNRAKSTNLHC
jgi:hypothetical protein